MPFLEGDVSIIFIDSSFYIENTAHIPLKMRGNFSHNQCIMNLGCDFCIHLDWL